MYSDDDNIKFIIIDYIKMKLSLVIMNFIPDKYVCNFVIYKQIITTFHLHFIIN